MNAGPASFEFQGQWFRTKRELFMSKNARHGRFLRLLLQVMAGSRSVWPGMGCLWGAEPLNRRKTRTDFSTSLLPISYKYDNSEAGIPTIIVTLLPWTTQLSGKICCPALLLTKREKIQFDWRQQDMRSPKSPSVWQQRQTEWNLLFFRELREKQSSLMRSLKISAM